MADDHTIPPPVTNQQRVDVAKDIDALARLTEELGDDHPCYEPLKLALRIVRTLKKRVDKLEDEAGDWQ